MLKMKTVGTALMAVIVIMIMCVPAQAAGKKVSITVPSCT